MELRFVAMTLAVAAMFLAWASAAVLAAPVSETILHASEPDFRAAELSRVAWRRFASAGGMEAGLALVSDARGYVAPGAITSQPIATAFPFDSVILSWNVLAPDRTGAVIEIRARSAGGAWTEWYQVARWGKLSPPTPRGHRRDAAGQINQDTLELKSKATAFQYRVSLLTEDSTVTPVLKLIAACYADVDSQGAIPVFTAPGDSPGTPWVRDLPVPFRSQRGEDAAIAGRICSPTSVAMVMEYHGVSVPTSVVAAQAHDTLNDIYGNWPFNTAAAASHGFEAYVTRFAGFEPIQEEIARGYPVIISIRFKPGELSGAPLENSDGHLLVIRGFTKDGDVIVNDPAGRTESEGHVVYRRHELLRAWKNGVAYIIHPPAR